MTMPAVRFADGSDDMIEGLAIPFGGPFTIRGRSNVDIYGTRFDNADLHLDWFPERPVLYHHGRDAAVGDDPVGSVRSADISDFDDGTRKGKWVKAQLNKRAEYYDEIAALVKDGKLGWSHGTLDYLMDVDTRTGDVRNWPIVEFTLTPVEANPDAFVSARSADFLRILGVSEAEVDAKANPASRGGSWDASTAAGIIASIYALQGNEAGEADQLAMLGRAADAMNEFMVAEAAEPDQPSFYSANRAGARNSAADQAQIDAAHQSAHTALKATAKLGATCDVCTPSDDGAPNPEAEADDDSARSAGGGPVIRLVTATPDVEDLSKLVDDVARRAADETVRSLLHR